jgi:hypothetical protein
MPCNIEIRKTIENSIDELLPNPEAVMANNVAKGIVKELNELWESAISRVVPYSGQGGALVKINSLDEVVNKEYKRQLKAEQEFERDLDFFKGDESLMQQEQRDLFFQKPSDEGQIASEKTIRDLAARISDRIGIPYRIISDRTQQFKGKIENNVAVINLAYATLDTPIHEILGHPIIRAIKGGFSSQNKYVTSEIEITQKLLNKEITREEAKKLRAQRDNPPASQLYQNLLKELEYGKGKEVLDRIKRDYQFKEGKSKLHIVTKEDHQNGKFLQAEIGEQIGIGDRYTLEEQQEEAIVELLGMMTAEKLDAVKDGKLISLLKRLLKEMKQFIRSLIGQKEVEIDSLPDNMTIEDLANILAYSNSKLILPGYQVTYTTPDNMSFKTYAEASNHISQLVKNVEDIDLNNVQIEKGAVIGKIDPITGKKIKSANYIEGSSSYFSADENQYEPSTSDYFYLTFEDGTSNDVDERDLFMTNNPIIEEFYSRIRFSHFTIEKFITKNKEFEQSKEIIEEWKKVNNIVYNPEEVYSRGQEFVSVVGAYSDFDVNLMMQNLLQHVEDNQKAGGEFTISAFTKPVDKKIGHLEGGGGKIKFKIYPQSKDIKWASNKDVYSGSVWDASEKVNKDKKSELLGVSYTKYPSLSNINSVQPNLANVIDRLAHHHNELGISLNGTNFRLEYDEDIPYETKKIINSINSILDQRYGKLVKSEIKSREYSQEEVLKINKLKDRIELLELTIQNGLGAPETYKALENARNELVRYTNIISLKGIQPTQTEYNLKESIPDTAFRVADLYEEGNTDGSEGSYYMPMSNARKKDYTEQALVNTKIAKLKEVAKKYPRTLIRSEVVRTREQWPGEFSGFEEEELPFQRIPSQPIIEETLPSNASPKTLKLIKDFLKQVGVDINVVKDIVVNGVKQDADGVAQIMQKLVSVVEGKEASALPEEAMHFAVAIIKQTNPKLYQKLMKEINDYTMLKNVFAEYGTNEYYQKDGKPDVIKLKEEAIAKVLVNKIIGRIETDVVEKSENLAKAQSWWSDIINWFKSLLYQKSGFDQAAIDIISGKSIGTVEDIRNEQSELFFQQSKQESIFNSLKSLSDRIEPKVDESSDDKEQRYFIDGIKKIARRVSDLTKDFFERRRKQQDLVQSEYEKAVTDLKAEKGTNGHKDFEHAFYLFTDENGYLKDIDIIEDLLLEDEEEYVSMLDPNDNDMYLMLRDNLLERMIAFEKANPKTRFLSEITIYDPSRDIAGTIDFMAISAEGKINILDWKFMGLNTEKYDEVPWYKVQSWRIQMEQYKLILKNNYGIQEQDFEQTRMIPILAKWGRGNAKKNILPRLDEIKIGDVIVKNISEDEGYLIPVATKGERTGNREVDKLLERLNTAYEKFSEVRVIESEKKNKADQLNALFSAIMKLQMQQDIQPLLKQANILHQQIENLKNIYETKYNPGEGKSFTKDQVDAFSEDEIDRFIVDHENSMFAIESYIDLYNDLESIIDAKDTKTINTVRETTERSRKYVTQLGEIRENFVRDVIAKRQGFNFFGMAEKTVKGLARLFSSTATIQTKAVQLLYKKASESLGFASMETESESFRLEQLKNEYTTWAKTKGISNNDLFRPIKKKDSNELIDEFKKEFYQTLRKKTSSKDEIDLKWIKENIDFDAYKEHLSKVLKEEIQRIENKPRGGSKLENERDVKRETDKAKSLYNISKKDSAGWLLYDEMKKFPKRDVWESNEWKYMNAPGNEPIRKFYDYVIEKNNEYAELGYIEKRYARIFLPYVRKSLVERIITKDDIQIGKEFMESISVDDGDVGYGGDIDPNTGRPKRSIPKYFVTKLDENVSEDLFRTMTLYNEMALRYKYLKKAEAQLRAVGQVERNKKSIDTSIFGKAKMQNGEPVKISDNRENSELYFAMMDAIIYDHKYIQSDLFDSMLGTIGGWGKTLNEKLGKKIFPEDLNDRQITVNKIVDNLNRSFQLTSLGLNPLSATSSFFGGNVQSIINAGKYFNKKDFLKSEYQLFVNKFNTLTGNETDTAKMFLGALNYFLPLTENANRELAKSLSIENVTQQGIQDLLMVLMRNADFAVQMTNFHAYLMNTIVVDDRIVNAREYLREQPEYANKYAGTLEERVEFENKFEEQVQKLIDEKGVMKLAKIENGRFVVPGVDRMSGSIIDVRRKVQQLNKDALGNLSEDDLRLINMNIMTKSMMVFKNWIPRLVDVRLGSFKYNAASDAYEWGRMRTVYSFLRDNIMTNRKGLVGLLKGNEDGIEIIRKAFEKRKQQHFEETGGEILELDEAMFIDLVRENIRAFALDLIVTLTVFAMVSALKALAPDDEDELVKNRYKFVVKAADKLKDELLYFWNPSSAISLLKSGVFPSLTLIDNGIKTLNNFFIEMFAIGTGNKTLEEDTKVIKYLMRTFPITNQMVGYLPMFYPDIAKDLGIQMQSNYGIR